jgi:hypothetical protein
MPRRDRNRIIEALEDLLGSIDLAKVNANDLEEPQDDETILPDLKMTDEEKKIFHAIKLRWKTFHLTQNDFVNKSLAMQGLNTSCVNAPIEMYSLLSKETLKLALEKMKLYEEILELSVAFDTSLQVKLPPDHGKDVFVRRGYVVVLKAKPKKP